MNLPDCVPAQIHRHPAAHRCEPMEPGYRDQLDGPIDLGRPARHHHQRRSRYKAAAIAVDDRTILVRTFGARYVLESGGMRAIFAARRRGCVLHATKPADAVAVLEHAEYPVPVRSRDAE